MDKINNIPSHVSIIMDGNGRWARQKGQQRVAGHFEGVESVRVCVEAAAEAGVKYLSILHSPKRTGGVRKKKSARLWA